MKGKESLKKCSFLLAFIMMFSLVFQFDAENVLASESEKVINILSFNDFHGALQESGKNVGAAKLIGELKKFKSENPNTVVVSGGDLFQGSPMSNLKEGQPVADMIKILGLKYSALGNHEFDWGRDKIPNWQEQGDFNFLAANLYDDSTNDTVSWVKPYAIEEVDGVKIGFIGLITPDTAIATKAENIQGLTFKDPVEIATQLSKKLKEEEKVDVVIALTHIGGKQSEDGSITGEVANLASVEGLDAIVSAHSHTKISGIVNDVPIVQGMNNGRAIAKLQISLNEDKTIKSIAPSVDVLYERADTLIEDAETKNMVDNYLLDLKPLLDEKIADLTVDLPHDRSKGLTELGEFVSKNLAEVAGTQICVMNGGGIRAPLSKGTLTMGDMYTVLPFDNTLVTMEIKGSDLKKVIENGIAPANYGWGQFYGLKVYYEPSKEFGDRILSMDLLDGTPVEMDKYYTLATNDMIYGGGDNYDFSGAINVKDTMVPLRDSLVEKFKTEGTLSHTYGNNLVEGPKPEEKPEEKPEVKPEVKPEAKPQVKPATKPSSNNKKKEGKLPQTGAARGNTDMLMLGFILVSSAAFIMIVSKKKDKNDVA
ncbi:5'-nucleotidase C-terminal domain-containing protein [Clostridium sp. CTA-19]